LVTQPGRVIDNNNVHHKHKWHLFCPLPLSISFCNSCLCAALVPCSLLFTMGAGSKQIRRQTGCVTRGWWGRCRFFYSCWYQPVHAATVVYGNKGEWQPCIDEQLVAITACQPSHAAIWCTFTATTSPLPALLPAAVLCNCVCRAKHDQQQHDYHLAATISFCDIVVAAGPRSYLVL
jgi:hypothetical protein